MFLYRKDTFLLGSRNCTLRVPIGLGVAPTLWLPALGTVPPPMAPTHCVDRLLIQTTLNYPNLSVPPVFSGTLTDTVMHRELLSLLEHREGN